MSTQTFSSTAHVGSADPAARPEAERPSEAVAAQIKASATQLVDDAKDSAHTQLNEKKDVAADGLRNVADALRDAAQRGAGDDPLLGLTASAADGLDRLSSALRNKDVGVMMRDVESFARAQPVAFFGLALATGFLAIRFMKAGRS